MKIYILTNEPFPNGMAATNRIKCLAKAIIENGWHCKVIIFTRTEVYGKVPRNITGEGMFEGIPYRYIGDTPLRNKNIIIRQLNDRVDLIRTLVFFLKHLEKDDIVIGSCIGHIHFINSIIDVIHRKKAHYVCELCELPLGTFVETSHSIKLRKKVLNQQFPKCDGFIAISEALVDLVNKYKSSKAVITKIPILVDFPKYAITDKSNETDVPDIFHSGTLSEQKDGILGIIKAFGIASHKMENPIRFILTGDKKKSPHKIEIDKLIIEYKLEDKIVFTGYLSENELREYLSKASLVVINKYKNQQNQYCFSTKLAEYLASAKPVIITNVGEAMNWLTDNKNAYIVEAQEIDALAEKIIEAFTNVEKRMSIAKNGYKTCKECFDYRNYSNQINDFFNRITNTI